LNVAGVVGGVEVGSFWSSCGSRSWVPVVDQAGVASSAVILMML